MRNFQPVGSYADWTTAPSPDDRQRTIKLGVRTETFQQYSGRVLAVVIAQYYGNVQPGLFQAQHAFKGLNRKLLDEEDKQAEQEIVVYSWRPLADYVWHGTPQNGMPVRVVPPPSGKVFVVLARMYPIDEHGIEGRILRWNWIREDAKLPKAPVEWGLRYGTRLWK